MPKRKAPSTAWKPESFDPELQTIDCGAPVLAIEDRDGVCWVTTTKGTFPIDLESPGQ